MGLRLTYGGSAVATREAVRGLPDSSAFPQGPRASLIEDLELRRPGQTSVPPPTLAVTPTPAPPRQGLPIKGTNEGLWLQGPQISTATEE